MPVPTSHSDEMALKHRNQISNSDAVMKAPDLLVVASDKETAFSNGYAEKPIWSHVLMRIERAFRFGGAVRLDSGTAGLERSQGFTSVESIAMESLPGKFRLIYSPKRMSLGEKSRLRAWWEPGETSFRGMERFGDDDWDARTVCAEVSVAEKIFKDFFDHGTLTEVSLEQMHAIAPR